jgi:hypothetical protein
MKFDLFSNAELLGFLWGSREPCCVFWLVVKVLPPLT